MWNPCLSCALILRDSKCRRWAADGKHDLTRVVVDAFPPCCTEIIAMSLAALPAGLRLARRATCTLRAPSQRSDGSRHATAQGAVRHVATASNDGPSAAQMAKPNSRSNIFKFRPIVPAGGLDSEGPAARRYREILDDNYAFHDAFWSKHNAAFKQEKEEFTRQYHESNGADGGDPPLPCGPLSYTVLRCRLVRRLASDTPDKRLASLC